MEKEFAMIKASKTYHRPDASVPWHYKIIDGKSEFMNRMREVYSAGLLFKDQIHSDDLTVTFITVWDTQELYEQYKSDPVLNVYWDARNSYNQNAGIIMDETVVETIDKL